MVNRFRIGKTGTGVAPGAGFPVAAAAPHPAGPFSREGRVVVADDLPALEVPLPRGDDDGAGVFQHGNQVGEDVPLRVHVLYRTVCRRPLPFPAFGLGFVIAAVALPEGDVSAGEAPAPFFIGADQGRRPALGVAGSQRGLHRSAVLADLRHRQFVEVQVFGVDAAERVSPVGRRGEAPEFFPEPLHVGGAPGEIGQFLAEVEIQRRPPFQDFGELERDFDPGSAFHAGAQGIGGGLEFPGGLGGKGENRQG